MWEYEFKSAINDLPSIRNRLKMLCGEHSCFILKNDTYYGENSLPLFRLRRMKNGETVSCIVTSKSKRTEGRSEISRETEFTVDAPESFEEFCSSLGFHPVIKKEKKTELFRYGKWNLELNEVESLGFFLEAEYLSEEELPEGVWEKERLSLMSDLGLKETDLEIRPYTELLSDKAAGESPRQPGDVIEIYSDGGCRPNPGAGAWAFVLLDGEEFRGCGGEAETTNNRMELTAAIEALEACLRRNGSGTPVRFHIDSQYVRNGITSWISGWKRKGWKSSTGEPVKNIDLWQRLDACHRALTVEWIWVKGHAGNEYNEICDTLCSEKIKDLKNRK